jgi:hypothetical protein
LPLFQPMRETAASPNSILSPAIDFLCVGGLALLILIPLLVAGPGQLNFVNVGWVLWLQAMINTAHFMASYRIVYRDRSMIMRHKWASIWVPLILIAVAVTGVLVASSSQLILSLFFAVSSAYLAWHYTGQVWGMMASYTFLAGEKFEKVERWLIRASLRILLAWHVSWFLHITMRHPEDIAGVYWLLSRLTVVAIILGVAGLLLFRRRTKRFPPARALVAWTSIFFWYAALARWGVTALFFVQLFHAIQYLEFPTRVELNRATARAAGRVMTRMAFYSLGLAVTSALVLLMVPNPAMSVVTKLFNIPPKAVGPVFALYFINIHHFFTDGVIWKISNPEVRKELFAHVPRPGKASVAAPQVKLRPSTAKATAR